VVGGRCPLVLRRLGPGTGGTRCRGPGPDCGDAGADDDRGDDQHDAAGAGDDRAEDRRRPPGGDVAIGHAEGHAHDAATDDAATGHGADEATQARRRVGWVVNTTTDTTFESLTFDALGTTVLIEACADIAGAEREVRAVLLAIDAACSRFRDDSELMVVNRSGGRPVVLSALAARAVRVALDAAARTGGAVDPTVGAAVRTLGYDITFEQLPSERPPVVRFVDTAGWRTVRLDTDGTVRVPDGVVLDLGATAKALAADLAAERAAVTTGHGVLVSIGGDIAVAGEPPRDGWSVGISDSHRTAFADVDETVTLWRGGLATSSTTVRRWRAGDTTLHHIVDPATGRPASGWRTVTAVADTCVDANVLATWGVIHGPGGAARAGCPYRAVTDAGAVVRGNGWPEQS